VIRQLFAQRTQVFAPIEHVRFFPPKTGMITRTRGDQLASINEVNDEGLAKYKWHFRVLNTFGEWVCSSQP
jgi:hypothetical protein